MRKTLFAAAALAPLWFLASQAPAAAQTSTTISGSTSTPVTTAQDGDITVSGSITPTAANTAAVTINSGTTAVPATVTNTGTISYKDVNNAVGVLLQGGNTGALVNSGSITVTETYTATDTNKDGVVEAPFASTSSAGRYGVQLVGSSAFVGSIVNTGTISVQGSNGGGSSLPSYGISLEAPLQGSVSNSGTITYVGDGGGGFRETAGITGVVAITGAISARGQNSNAVSLSGQVGGQVSVYAALTSTDYGLTTRATAGTTLATIEADASEVNPAAGSALIVSGSVGGGVFIGAPPANTNSTDTTTDRDGDGVVDSAETTGSITTSGSAPALVIGGVNNITLSGFTPVTGNSGNGDAGYGLVIEGTVSGLGVYDNVSATGLQIGGTLGGTTTLAKGVDVVGSVEASSYGTATATAIHIGAGAVVPTIQNSGTISAAVSPPNTITSTISSFTPVAIAIQIDAAPTGSTLAGGQVSTLINSGAISATVTGDSNDSAQAIAVVDRGGGISSVTNTGSISANFVADAIGAIVTGTSVVLADGNLTQNTSGAVALDLSANTSGTTLTQQQAPTQIVATTTANSISTSVVTYQQPASGTLTQSTTAVSTTVTSGDVVTVTTVPASPSILGDIYLGNGSNTVSILAGTVTGALSMGSGSTGSVTIDNGAIYAGTFTYTGGALALNVNNGSFDNSSASASPVTNSNVAYRLSSLKVGSTGILYFGVDPLNNRAATFQVAGAATIAAGAQLGLTFISNATAAQQYTIVSAGSLSVAETSTALTGPVPYMFNATLTPNTTAGTITLSISPKTPAELGLNPSQTAALPATYQALTHDLPVQTAFLDQYTRSSFLGVYNQVMPDYAGGTFQAANAASQAISRATAESNDIENPSGSRGAWAQELFIGVNQGSGQTDGFRGGGFGFVGGVETGGSGLGAFGTTVAFVTTSIADPHVPGDSQTALSELELGGYWQGEFSGFTADARIGAGYDWMAGRRELVQTDATTGDITLDRKAKSSWDGYTLSGRIGLTYKFDFSSKFLGGGWFLQPQTHLDYFLLDESGYKENAAQSIGELALAYNSRTGQESSGTASIVIGRKLGTGLVWRPQVEFGVRDVFSGDAGDTTARFLSGGPSFTLTPADITGAAGIVRLKLKASSEYYELGLEAGTEVLPSRYEEADVKASIRVLF